MQGFVDKLFAHRRIETTNVWKTYQLVKISWRILFGGEADIPVTNLKGLVSRSSSSDMVADGSVFVS